METFLTSANKLKELKDQGAILSLLSGARDLGSDVFIWRLVGGTKYLGKVRLEVIRKSRGDFSIVPSEGQDRLVQDLMATQSSIDLYIPESALILRCKIKQVDSPHRYYLQLPSFVAQAERRDTLRLNIYDRSEISISFAKRMQEPKSSGQYFLKNCFDVSTGGFSFLVSKMELKFFKEGDPISLIEFKTKEWTAKLNAEVMAIKETEPDEENGMNYKAHRVCCRFLQIDQISKKYLEKFVLERIKNELHAISK